MFFNFPGFVIFGFGRVRAANFLTNSSCLRIFPDMGNHSKLMADNNVVIKDKLDSCFGFLTSIGRIERMFQSEEEKCVRLSLHLICKRNLPQDAQKWDQDRIIEALNKITHLRLDRERIGEIDSLELLGDKCTNLYLQHNRIEVIQNLECLKNLTFVTLASNRITRIQNLRPLQKLVFLDLSENLVSTVDKDELPRSLTILNLKDNPCTRYPGYRQNLIHDLPQLKQLDLCAVTSSERGDVGLDVSSDDDDDLDDSEEEDEPVEQDNGHGKFESLQTISAGMMLRSQRRAEDALREHKNHISQLDDLRISWNIPPSSRSTARSNVL